MNFVKRVDDLETLPGVDLDLLQCKLSNKIDDIDHVIQQIVPLSVLHPDYGTLAARLELKRLYDRSIADNFRDTVTHFRHRLSPVFLDHVARLYESCPDFDRQYIRHERDRLFTYAALRTLQSIFLLNDDGVIFERPQFMFLRVGIQLHGSDVDSIVETYDLLSRHVYIHGTPTMINSGTAIPQLASCFLLSSVTLENFFDCMEKCRKIFQHIGGIGLALHKIPAEFLVPCIRILDNTLRLNSNARNSSCAVYIEPWHAGIYSFLELKSNTGDPECKARNLFYGLWVCDLFMKRIEEDSEWSLFCPSTSPGLSDVYGSEFEALYLQYEKEDRTVKKVRARDLFKRIIDCQIETGIPYFLYKDTANRRSPYKPHTIQCSNLCAEIIEFSSDDEIAVCNLASLSLPRFVVADDKSFDFEKLGRVTKTVVRNLDRTISTESLPVKEETASNRTYRPLGIGIQGLADVFQMLKLPFESPEARDLNANISKTIYESAKEASRGRHVLLTSYMPTATTSLLLDNVECFEPVTSNMYVRRLKWGNFYMVNKHLVADLIALGLWNRDTRNRLMADYGSVRNLENFPYRDVYKTVWEIPQKVSIDMAADRVPYVDQSQSLNIFMSHPTVAKISALHFYTWKKGLTTGMYYLRTKPACHPIQISVDCCSA